MSKLTVLVVFSRYIIEQGSGYSPPRISMHALCVVDSLQLLHDCQIWILLMNAHSESVLGNTGVQGIGNLSGQVPGVLVALLSSHLMPTAATFQKCEKNLLL